MANNVTKNIKYCKYSKNGYCEDGRNDWDGLCGPEACERHWILQLFFFGPYYVSFRQYIHGVEKEYKLLSKIRKNKKGVV